jgi:NNP family nitrate/nitrite transporter-like MFS transporter
LSSRDVWLLALCYGFYNAGYLGATGYSPTFLMEDRGESAEAVGTFVVLTGWTFLVGCLALPLLSDRIGRRRAVYLWAILPVGVVVASLGTTDLNLVPTAIAWGALRGALPLLFTVPLELPQVGTRFAGSAVGLIGTVGFAGGFVGPLVGMSLLDWGAAAAFVFWGGCHVVSAVLILRVPETGTPPGLGADPTSCRTRSKTWSASCSSRMPPD